jgi:predicted lipoprotein with Yx(FWY)xxD motif
MTPTDASRKKANRRHWWGVAVLPLGLALLAAGWGASSHDGHASPGPHLTLARSTAAAAATTLTLRSSEYGQVVSDAHNRVLYLFAADHGSRSTCYDECAKAWPPLLTKATPTAGAGLNSSLVGTTRRNDGSLQVTYAGHPLYYYSLDTGEKIGCQHVKLHGGFWYVVKPDGSANMAMGHGMMSPPKKGHHGGMHHGHGRMHHK